jgi:hypothetical protein
MWVSRSRRDRHWFDNLAIKLNCHDAELEEHVLGNDRPELLRRVTQPHPTAS